MTQVYNISIDGIDVTERQSGCSLSEEVNRVYDVATFTIDTKEETILDKDVVINYGDKTFSGFIYGTKKVGKNAVSVECRTHTAKLTEPYSADESVIDEASTSHTLCALYALRSGIPIVNLAADLDFGGSYERNGTMLSALTNIAAITAAEIYDDNGTLTIAPNKAIASEGIEIPESDIFDFVADSKSVYNKGVGFITIQSGADVSTDIISNNRLMVEIDECSGETFVFPNPVGAVEHSTGISPLSSLLLERKEDFGLLDEDVIVLDGAIESVLSVTLNGVSITNYNYEAGHNVLYFTTLMRGTLEVTYVAHAYKGYANITLTPMGSFISMDMYYLDQSLRFQGFLSGDCATTSTDGDMTCIVPSNMYYNFGFNMYTIGGVPDFTFYNKNAVILRPVVSSPEDYISVESVTLEEVGGVFRYKTRYPIVTALGARSANADVSYSTSVDGDDHYFEFAEYFPEVMISYQTTATRHYVQFEKILNGYVSMVVRNENTDQVCEYAISAPIPCELDQDVWVNVASELSLEVTEVYDMTVPVITPAGGTTNLTIDAFGYVAIYPTENGDYVINTDGIKPKTSITLTANV